MSTGWSYWLMFLVVLNMGITLFLFMWGPRAKIPTLPDGTSGHVWAHGALREGVRKLPLWWLLLSTGVGLLRERFDARWQRAINLCSAAMLGGLALWQLVQLVR